MPTAAVGQAEMDAIFRVTDALGIHREAVVVPLRPRTPGSVARKPNGKIEIVIDGSAEFDAWIRELPGLLRAATA
jgi:hypothetical protein